MRPEGDQLPSLNTAATAQPQAGTTTTALRASQIVTRADAPVVRNLRRDSASGAAAAALQNLGSVALFDELLQDRVARSDVAPAASLISTWHKFHRLAFKDAIPEVPVLPVTPRTLVIIGSMFKKGGRRPFSNYMSAAKAAHM